MRRILALSAVALLAAPAMLVSAAYADTISIGLKESGVNGGVLTTESTSSTGSAAFAGAYGTFNFNSISATGSPNLPEPDFDTNSIQVGSNTAGTIDVFITESDLTTPQGVAGFISGFSSNLFNGTAVSVRELTYISATDQPYTGTLLASTTFTALGASSTTTLSPNLSGMYSETVEYIVTVGAGQSDVNDTIDVSLAPTPVPEPISLALLGSGLLGLGAVRLRRRG